MMSLRNYQFILIKEFPLARMPVRALPVRARGIN